MRPSTSVLMTGATVLALAMGGCGGSDSGGGPEAAVKTYFSGLADGDGRKACSVLSLGQKGEIVAGAVNVTGEALGDLDRDRCEVAIERLSDAISVDDKASLRDATLRVAGDGDRRTVTVEGGTQDATVEKQDGRWVITSGLASGS